MLEESVWMMRSEAKYYLYAYLQYMPHVPSGALQQEVTIPISKELCKF
jgi:hypothetical protein